MELKTTNELKIGAMVFLAMAVVTLAIFYVGDFNFFQEGYTIKVLFNQATGITLGSPVNLNGIKIGEVKNIEFIAVDNLSKIRLTLWVNKKAIIHANSRFTIDSMGLMGEKVISIVSRDAASPVVQPNVELIGIDPPQIGELLIYGADIAQELKNTIKGINLIVGDAETKNAIRNNLKNTEALTKELAEIVNNSKENVVKTIDNTKSISDNLDKILTENRESLKDTMDNLKTASVTLKAGSASLEKFGVNVNSLVTDNQEEIKTIVDNLVRASDQLKTSLGPGLDNFEKFGANANTLVLNNQANITEIVNNLHDVTSGSRANILKAMENFEKVSTDIENISSKNQQNIQETVDNMVVVGRQVKDVLSRLKVIAEKIEKGEGTFGGLLTDKEMFDDLKKLIQDINAHPWKLLRKE